MNRIWLIISILTASLFVSCRKNIDSHPVIAVSVEPQRALLEEIVGDKYKVVTLLTAGANPETYDPTIKTRAELEKVSAYLTTGAMPFEERLASALPHNVVLCNVSTGITPIYGTHDHGGHNDHDGHNHGECDPHVWASVKNARIMARNMYNAVCRLDSANTSFYTARYNKLDAHLDSLDNALAVQLSGLHPRAFAIWHPSLSYFARDYELEQVAVGFENKEMSPKHLTQIVTEAREDSVKVFFFQREYDSRQAQSLNKQMGTKMVTINPLDYQWEQCLINVANALCQ